MDELINLLIMDQATLYEHVKSIDNPNYIKSIVPNGGILFIPLDEERYPLLCTHLDTINALMIDLLHL